MLSLSDFDYQLPKELIAQGPLERRDSSRLLILNRKSKRISHKQFSSTLEYLNKDDCLILNDTRVVPARLFGKKRFTGGKVELLLLERLNNLEYMALVKPTLKIGDEISFDGGYINCKVVDRPDSAGVKLMSNRWSDILSFGKMPLPPYIKRKPYDLDNERYQTVYAKTDGAIAAPTAGLHFTEELLQKIKAKGVRVKYLTLHIGYGTFKPVKCQNIKGHSIEPEYFKIPEETASIVFETKARGNKVIAVGTTTTRALETMAHLCKSAASGYTDLFIYPPYRFKIVDALLTNFHLPKTTLFMLVSAFAGRDLILEAYHQAIERRYRFYSYGDAMLII